MKTVMLAALATLASAAAHAETTIVDPATLPHKTVYEIAQLTPLALNEAGAPAVVLLRVPAGQQVPPHTAAKGLRLITVIDGELFWGDGDTINRDAETVHAPGSVLVLPAGVSHWLAARNKDVLIQLVVLDDERPVPAIQEKLQ